MLFRIYQEALVRFAAIAILFLAMVSTATAQTGAAASTGISNPVTTTVRQMEVRESKNIIGAGEEMPADKFSYRPTPEQMSFGHLLVHIAESNTLFCSRIAGDKPKELKLADTESKDALNKAVRDSFSYCEQVLAKADDSKLGEEIPLFGGQKAPRAAAFIYLAASWSDHYGAAAMYLRLNGLLPPSAKK